MRFYTSVYYDYRNILLAEKQKDGSTKYITESFKHTLFLPSNKETPVKSLTGDFLTEMKFDSYDEYKEFLEKYSSIPNFKIHGDISIEYQFISSRYGTNANYDFSQIDIMYIDIETASENGFPSIQNPEEEVIAISCTSTRTGKKTFCLGKFKTTEDIDVYEFDSEENLLYKFVEYFSTSYPDIVTGWNIRFFDFPYLINRINKILGKKISRKLSPWGIIKEKFITKKGSEEQAYDIVGIAMLDYYELYKTFTYVNQESYSLNHISWVELGERKLSYSEYESITDFYKKDFQKFIEYNIRDVELVRKLEKKLRLIELAVALAYSAGVNYQDVFSQVRTWDVIIYNDLKVRGIAIPPKKKERKDEQYAGAYVKEPLVGMHHWVASFDLNSLYPHLIMQYNISPETLTTDGARGTISPDGILTGGNVSLSFIEQHKRKDLSVAANGTTYRKDVRGFLPDLMEKMYKDRKEFKNKMIEAKKSLEDVDAELKRRGLTK